MGDLIKFPDGRGKRDLPKDEVDALAAIYMNYGPLVQALVSRLIDAMEDWNER